VFLLIRLASEPMEHKLRPILYAAEENNYESEKIKRAMMRVKIIPNETSLPQ